MIRLRTASGPIAWHDASTKEAAEMVASGRWLFADSLDYSRSKMGEARAETAPSVPPDVVEPVKRGPGRPRKAAE
jgi:hypothetical protein